MDSKDTMTPLNPMLRTTELCHNVVKDIVLGLIQAIMGNHYGLVNKA